ncbi:centromere-associated protein E-like [Sphaerodactylus townsendi]|nr:centromere-associated protein E-like [Sphaerodactylus townsendi]
MENKSSSAEFEYIKSLQRQVYFLELEANFLHEQTKKAASLHPQVTSEMEHRLQKLRELQSQSDGLQLELKRKESHLNMQRLERERLSSQIHVTDEHYSKEKQTLLEEIMQLKRQKARKDQHISSKEMEILHVKQELEQQKMNLSNSEKAILVLQAKVS